MIYDTLEAVADVLNTTPYIVAVQLSEHSNAKVRKPAIEARESLMMAGVAEMLGDEAWKDQEGLYRDAARQHLTDAYNELSVHFRRTGSLS